MTIGVQLIGYYDIFTTLLITLLNFTLGSQLHAPIQKDEVVFIVYMYFCHIFLPYTKDIIPTISYLVDTAIQIYKNISLNMLINFINTSKDMMVNLDIKDRSLHSTIVYDATNRIMINI